jgi:hypothetical protein
LLTKVYGLPPEKLWATVYIDDDEAFDLWTKDIGVPPDAAFASAITRAPNTQAIISGRWPTPVRADRARNLL